MTMISDRLLLERIRELKKAATPASLADAELLEELSSARAKLRVYREASGEPVAWMFHRAQIPRGTWWPWKLSFKQPPEYKGGFRIESVPLYASSQAVPEYPETLPCPVHLVPGLRLGKGCKTETLLIALQRRAEYYAGLDAMTPEERAKHYANIEAFKAMLPQPVQVAPEDLRRSFEAVARLNNEMYRWTSCMSYNGSYVGEPEGLLKRNIREIERILDRCKSDKGE